MQKKEPKPFKTYEEQIAILKSRGLIIENDEKALGILSSVGYYRFINAYSVDSFDKSKGKFEDSTTIDKLFSIYEFDRNFRDVLFGKLEIAEVKLRTAVAYQIGKKYGPLGYLKRENFLAEFDMEKFKEHLGRETEAQKSSLIVKHHEMYKGMPIWAIVEIISFGTLSNMFKFLSQEDKDEIIRVICKKPMKAHYFVKSLTPLVNLRNACAHYARLYKRKFDMPEILLESGARKFKRAFPVVVFLVRFLSDSDAQDLIGAIDNLQDLADLSHYGFPEDWSDIMQAVVSGRI